MTPGKLDHRDEVVELLQLRPHSMYELQAQSLDKDCETVEGSGIISHIDIRLDNPATDILIAFMDNTHRNITEPMPTPDRSGEWINGKIPMSQGLRDRLSSSRQRRLISSPYRREQVQPTHYGIRFCLNVPQN
uniref:Uncharacterized protein n=1 Tax=Spongospora subterranea TaxID=70186 RepID=A0A0H5QKH4_9EUKA|eukprot:CRZ02132.1 hypothetical protein [Spongospora subterranea]